MSDFFDGHYKRYDAWYDENKFAYLSELEAVKKAMPDEGYGLEIGVGSGRFAVPLGINVGIDPSKKMVELAKERGVDAILGAGEALPFKDSTFDYVVIVVALCFVDDSVKVIQETARVLKKNGRIIIGIIDKESFLGELYQKKESIFYDHARFFSVKEIIKILTSAGFREIRHYQTIFDYPDKVISVDDAVEGYGKGGFVVTCADL